MPMQYASLLCSDLGPVGHEHRGPVRRASRRNPDVELVRMDPRESTDV